MGCPEWLRKDMKKSGQSKPSTGVKDMGSLFHGSKMKGYADGGEVETLKQEGLAASANENVGFFKRLGMGNIDDPNSEAYRRFGAGRGAEERMQKREDARDAAMTDIMKNAKPQGESAPDYRNEMDKASDAAASAPKEKPAARQAPRSKAASAPKAPPAAIPKTVEDAVKPKLGPVSSYASTPSKSDLNVMFRDADRGGTTGLNYLKRMIEANELGLADAQRARRILKERNAE